ncbi:MAG: type II toxin-antitoxin system RelE/ParE family toxin [Nitrospinota bacterium]|jgi:proteic killer suppression protein|nr:type II toxin-antitoxin system RelE/ParE family toxin [Nitrospinota bacterium]
MIKSFADKHTRDLYLTGKSKKIHPKLIRKAVRRLEYVEHAFSLIDLKVPPSNRLHALSGDRKGQYSISINDQWRICFRFEKGNAYDVKIVDYH